MERIKKEMIKNELDKEFNPLDLKEFVIPKYVEKRGFLYVLVDNAFPKHFKVGRTADVAKRLEAYNAHKPYLTAEMYWLSKEFIDVIKVEEILLKYLYSEIRPTTFRKEWFEIVNLGMVLKLVQEIEDKLE